MSQGKQSTNGKDKSKTTVEKIEELWKAAKEDPSFSKLAAKPAQEKKSTRE